MQELFSGLMCLGAGALFFLFFVYPFMVTPSSRSPKGDTNGLYDEDGHLTIRGMAFYDGLDGSFDGAPPDMNRDWF